MFERLRHYALFALYQVTVAVGIALLPVAVVLDRYGFTLPMHRVVDALDGAVEATRRG